MKVLEKGWRGGEEEYELSTLLVANLTEDSGKGELEDLQRQVEVLRDALGNLFAYLVNKKQIPLDDAYSFCNGFGCVREVKE